MFAYQLFATSSAARICVHICCALFFYPARQNLFRMVHEKSHFLWTHNWQISRSSWSTNTYFLKIRIQQLNVNGDLFHLQNTINHLNLKIIINIGKNTLLWLYHIFFNICLHFCIFKFFTSSMIRHKRNI